MLSAAFAALWLASLVIVAGGLLRLLLQTALGGWLLLAEARARAPARGPCLRRASRATVPAGAAGRYAASNGRGSESRAVA